MTDKTQGVTLEDVECAELGANGLKQLYCSRTESTLRVARVALHEKHHAILRN